MTQPATPSWSHLNLSTDADRAELGAHFRAHGVRDVECLFADVTGYPRGKLMPAASFAAGGELRICQAIPMQCVTGEYSYDPIFPDSDPDVRLVPDLDTLKLAPWASVPRYMAVHDCVELDGSLCEFAPRSVLKNVVARYTALGLTPVVAPEIEFYLTAAMTDPAQPLTPPLGRGGRPEVGQSAFSLNALNELAPFWDAFHAAIDALGIRADTWLHEVGPSQYEINLLHGDPVAVADQAFLFKTAAREIALQHGLNAVFMAKPLTGEAGSSMHLHQSVVDAQGRNIFSQADGTESEAFLHYIGGLQAYTPDLTLIYAPTVNSYRRYVTGSQAPINVEWGRDNRTAGLRVPVSAPVARRVENRLAGADANPYLAIAATLAAGLAGMQERRAPGEPVQDNGYDLPRGLPRTFSTAHEQMAQSGHAARLLGERFVRAYLAVKGLEHDHFLNEISAWERRFLLPQV
ncbi:MAG: glutamine synthetase family protein [Hydrogenophaga sp.]|jgi:glutamine synthetase|uniref:glutamine synthetase family protein n=1 Tax=Hydrogenophaga sp. TaxID=1904254 RepID=UPI001DAFAB5A|nr:glutamine synthetase family protein [Hydrogenophaga sp.]MBW0169437.1 glutamine synthetase family protein [Hydrogenophaga sp.]MBW0182588.1 glutamine synthetase family protein [Hydrogenophaga sp.]